MLLNNKNKKLNKSVKKKWDCSRHIRTQTVTSRKGLMLYTILKVHIGIAARTVPDFFGLVRDARKKIGTATGAISDIETLLAKSFSLQSHNGKEEDKKNERRPQSLCVFILLCGFAPLRE
jgi:hypothetical protein